MDEVRTAGVWLAVEKVRRAVEKKRVAEPEWTLIPDSDLLAQVLTGDHAAFSALMLRYNRTLYRVARGVTGDDGEAEDIVQEAWVRAYTHFAEFRGESRLATWLIRITLNEALGRKRRARPTVEIDEMDGHQGVALMTFPSHLADPESSLSRTQVRKILEEAIDLLPAPFRMVFVMRAIEELSVEEVAAQLGIPEATVRTRMHRSRALLGRALEKKLGACVADVFPFAGDRCQKLRERVLARVKALDKKR